MKIIIATFFVCSFILKISEIHTTQIVKYIHILCYNFKKKYITDKNKINKCQYVNQNVIFVNLLVTVSDSLQKRKRKYGINK